MSDYVVFFLLSYAKILNGQGLHATIINENPNIIIKKMFIGQYYPW
jgi:hypothetical protein